MKQSEKNYKRIVIKVGSSLLCLDNNILNFSVFEEIATQAMSLVKNGNEVVIVSSGAIALGMHLLGLKERPKKISDVQAVAAIGQNELMNTYRKIFKSTGFFAAQILLTYDDFDDRRRYLNARNTLLSLLEPRKYRLQLAIPIVNENDTISTDEIKFGDNDKLSALVASLISANILIILSDVDGLLNQDKKIIPLVEDITPEISSLACPTKKENCVGGMITKIEAAKIAMGSGIPCVIANGHRKHIIFSVIDEPEKNGTLFISKKYLTAKKHWIAFGTKTKGNIFVDEGAKKALINKKSLLSVGIVSCEGSFESGDVVSVRDKLNNEFARGKVNLSGRDLDKVKGTRYHKEIIHRDNIVIL